MARPERSGGVDPLALAVLAGGVVAVSTAATLIRLAHAPPLAVAAYRMAFATGLLAPFAIRRLPADLRGLRPADRALVVGGGLCLAVHFALWIASLGLTSVASSVALVTTSPLWVAVAAPIVLGSKVSPRLAAGVITAFVGAVLIGGGDLGIGHHVLRGDVLALGGAVAAAAYFLIGAGVRPRLQLVSYVTLVYGIAAAALLVACVLAGTRMSGYPPATWLALFLLGAVPQVLGHSSFNWALERLSATFVSATVLGEAVGSTLLAWWVLKEAPPPQAVAGGALVLLGLALAAGGESAVRVAQDATAATEL